MDSQTIACTAQRKGRPYACCPLANTTDLLTPVLWTMAGGWIRTAVLFFAVCGPKLPRLCQRTRERSQFATPFFDYRYLVPFRRDSRSKCEVKSSEIAPKKHVFGPQIFFGGRTPNFGLSFLKLHPFPIMWQNVDWVFSNVTLRNLRKNANFVAKFRGDRPTDRGDLALKKKEREQQNIRARALHYHNPTQRAALISLVLRFFAPAINI